MVDPVAYRLRRDVVSVTGEDAESFLQGQVSQDVSAIRAGGSAWSFLLQPDGKLGAWFRLARDGARFDLDIDPGFGPPLVERLERFLLRMDCHLAVAELDMIAIREDDAVRLESAAARDPEWPGVIGVDLLGADLDDPVGVTMGPEAQYERARILAGIPVMGQELTPGVIPGETPVVDRSVSFTKGCFVGQELVARIDARGGNTPRRIRLLRSEAALAVGDEVWLDGVSVGAVTSAAPGDGQADGVALATLHRRVEPPVEVLVGPSVGEHTSSGQGSSTHSASKQRRAIAMALGRG